MSKAWMPLYIGDYLGDTSHLTQGQHGAYLLLIMHCWRHGMLPIDREAVYRLGRAVTVDEKKAVEVIIDEFFVEVDGVHSQKRVTKELARTNALYDKRAQSGSKGGRSKWGEVTSGDLRSDRLAKARQLARHSVEQWNAVVLACGGACVICGVTGRVVKDHIKPIYQGGSDGIENLQPLCDRCNSKKGPDSTDHRPESIKLLAKRLANGDLDCDCDSSSSSAVDLSPKEGSDQKIAEIAKHHPKIPDHVHIACGVEGLIIEAVVRHGYEKVLDGTLRMEAEFKKRPKVDFKFVPPPEKFYPRSEYLLDSEAWRGENSGPQNVDEKYIPESEKRKRELNARKAAGL